MNENKLLAILYSPKTSQHQFIVEHLNSIKKTVHVCFIGNTFSVFVLNQTLLHTDYTV